MITAQAIQTIRCMAQESKMSNDLALDTSVLFVHEFDADFCQYTLGIAYNDEMGGNQEGKETGHMGS